MSLAANSVYVDNMLAQMQSAKYNSTEQFGRRQSANKDATAAGPRNKKKAINQTPQQGPYCRHKEFQKMPKYSLDAVSVLSSPNNFALLSLLAMHKNCFSLRGLPEPASLKRESPQQIEVDERARLQNRG